ncbi:hypothetical protein I6N90_11485 [Paenibacillus sp. GSMTC-2017]|uniref:hypothetical protein n=1 Tax=Paenibacillus sp. GSMTC-2017 TaxID=2794350 RepID=UPI0018D5CBE0|nr:hypothetical protein [Paenibacillus sp. GSMTC-2017]MBH5318431.1 hypothetical protein [Paenibacillus sp. GSMTC-2017]
MNEKELITSISRLNPTKEQKERMLSRILVPEPPRKMPLKRRYKIAIPALCGTMLSLAFVFPIFYKQDAEIPQLVALKAESMQPAKTFRHLPVIDLIEPQKFMNYNGFRYTFLNEGAPYDQSSLRLNKDERLGVLSAEIQQDIGSSGEDGYDDRDFATTYLVGGELYPLQSYDPSFRLAVAYRGQYYIAQLAGKADNSIIPAEDYLDFADMDKLAERVDIMNISGSDFLHSLEIKKDIRHWIAMLRGSEEAVHVTKEDYEQLVNTDPEGKSYLVRFHLKDSTLIDMYIIPELKLASFGDGRYILPDSFTEDYAKLFSIQ